MGKVDAQSVPVFDSSATVVPYLWSKRCHTYMWLPRPSSPRTCACRSPSGWRTDSAPIDYPSKRRINTKPIPRLGGLAMFAGLCVALIVEIAGIKILGWPPILIPHPSMRISYPILGLSFLVIVITGAVDDVHSLSPRSKLLGQILSACIAAAGGLLIGRVVNPFARAPISSSVSSPTPSPSSISWPSRTSSTSSMVWTAWPPAFRASRRFLCSRSPCSPAASTQPRCPSRCSAPASPFCATTSTPRRFSWATPGSLLLGFGLGTISLLNVSRTAALTSLIIPLIVAGVPILDTLSAIIRRKRAHVSIGQADTGHIHHRLIREGYDQRQAVLLIYAWCLLLSLGAVVINQVSVGWRVAIFLVLLACSALFATRLHLFEPVLRHHYNPKTQQDEIVTPDDPAFAAEERAAAEMREERLEHLIPGKSPKSTDSHK